MGLRDTNATFMRSSFGRGVGIATFERAGARRKRVMNACMVLILKERSLALVGMRVDVPLTMFTSVCSSN